MARPIAVGGRMPAAPRAQRAHPLATPAMRNARTFPEGTELVPCGHCRTNMPAIRLNYPAMHGECEVCCSERRRARPAVPELETVVWSRGERL